MANVFDQFDQNVFDQFDNKPEKRGPFAAAQAEGSTFKGLGEAVVSLARGAVAESVAGLVGIPAAAAGFVGGGIDGEGAINKATRFGTTAVDATRKFIAGAPPQTESGQKILEKVGKVSEAGVKAVRVPFAGLGGIISAISNPRDAINASTETINRVIDDGIGPTAGSALAEAGAPPIVSALVDTAPTAAAVIAGTRASSKPVSRPAPVQPKPNLKAEPGVSVGAPKLDKPVDFTPREPLTSLEIVEKLKKGKPESVADSVLPDVEIIESARRLGVDLNPEHYSTNAAFQDVARSLKNQPGSRLENAERAAMRDIAVQADKLVEDLGGSIDKSAISDRILVEMTTVIDDLKDQADVGYGAVREAIPVRTRVKTDGIREYLDSKLLDLGGDVSLLSTSERKLYNLVNKLEGSGTVTYAALDRVRKDIGNGFNRRGPFADDDIAILSEVYGVLSDTQNGVAGAFGVGDIYANARQLVARRKTIEDEAVALFGRNLSKTLVPQMRSSSTGLTKGDIGPFNRLMSALPESRRSDVAATILGDLFSGGSRRGGELGTGFAASFAALNRSPTAKNALLQYLPAEGRRRFNDIGRVVSGIVKSNQKPLSNPSGSAGPIIQAFNDASAIRNIYSVGKKIAAAEMVSTSVSLPGAGTAGVIGSVLSKKKVPAIVAADSLIASPEFTKAIQVAIDGDVAAANRIITNSPKYKKWESTATPEQAQRLARLGFISWLISEEQ